MSVKRSGLGRGLDALLPKSDKTDRAQGLQQIALERLKPSSFQPRKRLDPAAIAELAASITERGVLQPLLLRPAGDDFEIVAGERRFRAAQQAGLSSVPAIVKDLDDQATLEIAIVENLQRENLSALEEAQAFKQLMGFGMSQEGVAKAVGKSRSAVANTLRLLSLGDDALKALDDGVISAGHARAILAQPEEDKAWALEQITHHALTVRQAEALSRADASAGERETASKRELARHFETLEQDLARTVGTKVRISGERRGKIELHYYTPDDLQRLLELLGYETHPA